MNNRRTTHSIAIGYIAWILGFMGAHRFYYGKPITGTIWFFTFGLFFVGWIIDLFLIPEMDAQTEFDFEVGSTDYSLTWIFLTFLGIFGVHRFYMGKWVSGTLYLFTFGVFGLGILYDYWTLNLQIDEINVIENRQYRYS